MRLRRLSAHLTAALALATLLLPAPAAAGERWKLLGSTTVSDRLDRDVITVSASRGTFDRIRLAVKGRAVQFRALTIHFANGDAQEVELRDVIEAGGESRVIDVAGSERVIRSISLVYDAQSLGGRAKVRVYGHG